MKRNPKKSVNFARFSAILLGAILFLSINSSTICIDTDQLGTGQVLNDEPLLQPISSKVETVTSPNTDYLRTVNIPDAKLLELIGTNTMAVSFYESGNYKIAIIRINGMQYTWMKNFSVGANMVGCMKANGDTLYVGLDTSHEIRAYNLTNPVAPVLMDTKTVGANPLDIMIEGGLMWVYSGYGADALSLFNITKPNQMANILSRSIAMSSGKLVRVGNFLLAGNRIFNITKPLNPVDIGKMNIISGMDIEIVGRIAYVLGYYKSIMIYDLSDILHPTLIDSISVPQEWASDLDVFGRLMVSAGKYLIFLNCTDLYNPVQIGMIQIDEGLIQVILSGNRIYMTGGNYVYYGTYAHPVQNLEQNLINDISAQYLGEIQIDGDKLFGMSNQKLDVYDITDLNSMVLDSTTDDSNIKSNTFQKFNGFLVDGNRTYNIDNLNSITYSNNSVQMISLTWGVTGYGMSPDPYPMLVYNLTDPRSVTVANSIPTSFNYIKNVYENFLLVYNGSSLKIFDLINPFKPVLAKTFQPNGGISWITVVGNTLYLKNGSDSSRVDILNASALPKIQIIGRGSAQNIMMPEKIMGNYMVVRSSYDIDLWDVSSVPLNGQSMTKISDWSLDTIQRIQIDGDLLWGYLGGSTQRIQTYRWLMPFAGDEDDDGMNGLLEAYLYSTSPTNNDTDMDNMTDGYEIQYSSVLDPNNNSDKNLDSDVDHLTNLGEFKAGSSPILNDTDGDRLLDGDEVNQIGTSPIDADTDGDSILDNMDDQDGDHLGNQAEVQNNCDPRIYDSDFDGVNDYDEVLVFHSDPRSMDSDHDGLNDYTECFMAVTDPMNNDSDSDRLSDFLQVDTYLTNPLSNDTDGDTVSDYDEVLGTVRSNPLIIDSDFDGLTDLQERQYNTSPYLPDSDKDGLSDAIEVSTYNTDPNNADSDSDGVKDGDELYQGTDPLNDDSDGDFLNDSKDFAPTTAWWTLAGTVGSVIGAVGGIFVKLKKIEGSKGIKEKVKALSNADNK